MGTCLGMAELFDPAFLHELEALNMALLRMRGRAGEGISRAGRSSGQTEFRGHRPYSMGDDVRRLDWNAYGRLGRMFVREFERERREHLSILLDRSRSMDAGSPAKHLFARRIAAALGFLALKGEGTAALYPEAAIEGVRRLNRWLDLLRASEPNEARSLSDRLRELASMARTPSDVVVISDFMEPLAALEALGALSERRCAVTLIQVLSPDEIAPQVRGTVDLAPCEEGGVLRMELDASSLGAYGVELGAHLEALETLALRFGWTYALAPSDSDLRALFTGKLSAVGAGP